MAVPGTGTPILYPIAGFATLARSYRPTNLEGPGGSIAVAFPPILGPGRASTPSVLARPIRTARDSGPSASLVVRVGEAPSRLTR
jgi:hypothetical protein